MMDRERVRRISSVLRRPKVESRRKPDIVSSLDRFSVYGIVKCAVASR